MSITEELRKWADERFVGLLSSEWVRDLNAIADRIDEQAAKMYEDLTIGMEPMTEDNMARDGWVKLPVDADGVPIHVGDVMEWPTTGETFEVVGIGDGTLFYIEDGSECADWTGATTKRHHQPDSWERIIKDAFVESQEHFGSADAVAELVERCRRLAGEGE